MADFIHPITKQPIPSNDDSYGDDDISRKEWVKGDAVTGGAGTMYGHENLLSRLTVDPTNYGDPSEPLAIQEKFAIDETGVPIVNEATKYYKSLVGGGVVDKGNYIEIMSGGDTENVALTVPAEESISGASENAYENFVEIKQNVGNIYNLLLGNSPAYGDLIGDPIPQPILATETVATWTTVNQSSNIDTWEFNDTLNEILFKKAGFYSFNSQFAVENAATSDRYLKVSSRNKTTGVKLYTRTITVPRDGTENQSSINFNIPDDNTTVEITMWAVNANGNPDDNLTLTEWVTSLVLDFLLNPEFDYNHALLQNLDYASSGHTGFAGLAVANTYTANQFFNNDISVFGTLRANTLFPTSSDTVLVNSKLQVASNLDMSNANIDNINFITANYNRADTFYGKTDPDTMCFGNLAGRICFNALNGTSGARFKLNQDTALLAYRFQDYNDVTLFQIDKNKKIYAYGGGLFNDTVEITNGNLDIADNLFVDGYAEIGGTLSASGVTSEINQNATSQYATMLTLAERRSNNPSQGNAVSIDFQLANNSNAPETRAKIAASNEFFSLASALRFFVSGDDGLLNLAGYWDKNGNLQARHDGVFLGDITTQAGYYATEKTINLTADRTLTASEMASNIIINASVGDFDLTLPLASTVVGLKTTIHTSKNSSDLNYLKTNASDVFLNLFGNTVSLPTSLYMAGGGTLTRAFVTLLATSENEWVIINYEFAEPQ